MNTTDTEKDHALENAEAWLDSIVEMIAKLDATTAHHDDDCEPDCESDACFIADDETQEAAREEIQESPLSVLVRSDWHSVGESASAAEFEILLSTGGPALRIIGKLDDFAHPSRPRLQYQDWGTEWTERIVTGEKREALETFCEQFYFGEG